MLTFGAHSVVKRARRRTHLEIFGNAPLRLESNDVVDLLVGEEFVDKTEALMNGRTSLTLHGLQTCNEDV